MSWRLVWAFLLLSAACGRPAGAPCGIAAIAGPTTLLTQFSVPQQTLSTAPSHVPGRLVVRVVAGPAYPAVVGRADSMLVVGVQGALPPKVAPQFGVLVVDRDGRARGVMLYEVAPVEGAPQIGTVALGAATIPLVGIEVDPAKIEDARCPFFPDSVLLQ